MSIYFFLKLGIIRFRTYSSMGPSTSRNGLGRHGQKEKTGNNRSVQCERHMNVGGSGLEVKVMMGLAI